MVKSFLLLTFSVFLFSIGGETAVMKQQEKLLYEAWDAIQIDDSRAGYEHLVALEVEEEGEKRVRTYVDAKVSIQRTGFGILIVTSISSLVDSDGRLKSFSLRRKVAGEELRIEGTPIEEFFFIKTRRDGKLSVRQIKWDRDALSLYGERLAIKSHPRTPGSLLRFKVFSYEYLKVVEIKIYFKEWELTEFLGGKRKLQDCTYIVNEIGATPLKLWLDEEGEITKIVDKSVGIPISVYKVSPEEALGGEITDERFVPAGKLSIQLAQSIPYPRRVEEAVYRLRLPKGKPEGIRLEDDRQKVVKRDGDRFILKVSRKVPEGPSPEVPGSDPAWKPFLEDDRLLCWRSPEILSLSRKVVGEEKDGWKAALKLEEWVYKNIKRISFQVGTLSAREVLQRRIGDSFAHSILLASMTRAAGIPSRIVVGLIHYDRTFSLHTWIEVFVGQWMALDPSCGKGGVDAAHIKIAESPFGESKKGFDFKGINTFVSNLELEVLEFKRDGRPFKNLPGVREGTLEGDSYKNLLYGLSFEKPEGTSFKRNFKETPLGEGLVEVVLPEEKGRIMVSATSISCSFNPLSIKVYLSREGMNILQWSERMIRGYPAYEVLYEEGEAKGRLVLVQDEDMSFQFDLNPLSSSGEEALERALETFRTGAID